MLWKIPVKSIEKVEHIHLCEKKGSARFLHDQDVFVIEPRTVQDYPELFWHIRDNGDAMTRSEILAIQE